MMEKDTDPECKKNKMSEVIVSYCMVDSNNSVRQKVLPDDLTQSLDFLAASA